MCFAGRERDQLAQPGVKGQGWGGPLAPANEPARDVPFDIDLVFGTFVSWPFEPSSSLQHGHERAASQKRMNDLSGGGLFPFYFIQGDQFKKSSQYSD
jgi:hypothetical protein